MREPHWWEGGRSSNLESERVEKNNRNAVAGITTSRLLAPPPNLRNSQEKGVRALEYIHDATYLYDNILYYIILYAICVYVCVI